MDFLIPEVLNKGMFKYSKGNKLSELSSMRVGGVADYTVYPESIDRMIYLIRFSTVFGIPYRVIGCGTNTLFLTDRFRGLMISTKRLVGIYREEACFTVDAGVRLGYLLRFAAGFGLGGAEGLSHIPGSIGGALRSNAGAFGSEIKDILVSARVYLPEFDKTVTLTRDDLGFSYRNSLIKSCEAVVLSARFEFKRRSRDFIRSEFKRLGELRAATQPRGVFSLGSVFKRVGGVSAGYYIDRCGYKGFRIGGAEVSDKHAGFIVNRNLASRHDVACLIDRVASAVYHKFGIVLDKEIEIVW